MGDSRSSCRASSDRSDGRSLTTFVPVIGDVICEGPGVIYVSIDPDVWRIRCQQCQQKTEHKCPLKKVKSKFKKRGGDGMRRDFDDSENGSLALVGEGLGDDADAEGKGGTEGEGLLDEEEDMCQCADAPPGQRRPKTCLCNPFVPVDFLLEVQVTGEPKPEFTPKKKKHGN